MSVVDEIEIQLWQKCHWKFNQKIIGVERAGYFSDIIFRIKMSLRELQESIKKMWNHSS